MDQIPNTSEHVELVEATVAKLKAEEDQARAETKVVNAMAMKHRLFGFAALTLCAGLAAGGGLAGYAYFLDRQADLHKPAIAIAEAMAAALRETELPVRPVGEIALTTAAAEPIKLSTDGVTVRLNADNTAIHIVDSDIRKVVEVVEHYLNRRSASAAAGQATTSLDVVKTARTPSGIDVLTRWEHTSRKNDSAPGQPLIERCFVRQTGSAATERLLEIARNQQPGARPKEITEPNFQDALRHCVWSSAAS